MKRILILLSISIPIVPIITTVINGFILPFEPFLGIMLTVFAIVYMILGCKVFEKIWKKHDSERFGISFLVIPTGVIVAGIFFLMVSITFPIWKIRGPIFSFFNNIGNIILGVVLICVGSIILFFMGKFSLKEIINSFEE
jgi:hypothetical protein